MKYFKNYGISRIITSCVVILLAFAAVLLQGKCCGSAVTGSAVQGTDAQDNITNTTDGKDITGSGECLLDVRVGFGGKAVIPDPAKTDGKVSVSLLSKKNVKKVYKDGKWYKKNGDLYLGTDLSFAGFKRPVFVSSYAIGDMTEKSGIVSYISKKTDNGVKKKKVKGSCLVLFVTTKLEKYEESDESYFVILDYKNGVSYKKKSNLYLRWYYSEWVRLSVADVTGDGVQELLASSLCNKSINFEVYHAGMDTHKIKTIYGTNSDWEKNLWKPGWDFIDRREFKGKLKDNYKMELTVPCIGYSQIISLIKDGGYSKKYLQKKMRDKDWINYTGMWKKNGKVRKKWAKKYGRVFLYTLEDVSCQKDKDGNVQIELVRPICIGHRSTDIGNMHIYLGYDQDLGKLAVKDAKYSDYKKSCKEWEKARKKYGGFNWK